MSTAQKELLRLIVRKEISIKEIPEQELLEAIEDVLDECDRLQKTSYNDDGEEIMSSDEAVEDDETYMK